MEKDVSVNMRIIYSNQKPYKGCKEQSLFLVGPTPRDKETPSWRPEAIKILEKLEFKGTVLVPEPENGEKFPNYDNQVDWEYSGLSNCSHILAWVPRNKASMPALTTNVEFGYWISNSPHKFYYGRPDNADSIRYLDWMYEKFTSRKPENDLEDLIKLVVKKDNTGPNYFCTADWHVGETRFDIMNRPFIDVQEHIDFLVKKHNEIVKPQDIVYVLGDVVYQKATKSYLKQVDKFNGKKILVRGNHDKVYSDIELKDYFEEIIPEGEGIELKIMDIPCYMTHFPSTAKKDLFNLVGHIHSAWKYQLNMYNVGVDVNHFAPINLMKIPGIFDAVSKYYDDDVWAAYSDVNSEYRGKRGKEGSYFK